MDTLASWWSHIQDFLANDTIMAVAQGLLILVVGWWLARVLSKWVARALKTHLTAQASMLLRRAVFYTLALVSLFTSLQHMGLDLAVLLGAAGILTVALGFASQTSASNLISGLFLIFEQPFVVGDTIRVGQTTGIVLSVDLLSAKLRTFDNLFVRVPNETLVKSEIINLSHFPIRRFDLLLSVAYREDLEQVQDTLREVARAHTLVFEEPDPLILFLAFADSSVNLQFSVWTTRESYPTVRHEIPLAVKQAFELEGIQIPFPHRVLVPSDPPNLSVGVLDTGH